MADDFSNDFREEIRIAQLWRGLIGDAGYLTYDADDILRWHQAMELRGPDEIRAMLVERRTMKPASMVTGIVAKAPHPPRSIVEVWLETYEAKTRTGPYWFGAAAFIVLIATLGPFFSGCQNTPFNPNAIPPPTDQQKQVTTTPVFPIPPTPAPGPAPPISPQAQTPTGPLSAPPAGGGTSSAPH